MARKVVRPLRCGLGGCAPIIVTSGFSLILPKRSKPTLEPICQRAALWATSGLAGITRISDAVHRSIATLPSREVRCP